MINTFADLLSLVDIIKSDTMEAKLCLIKNVYTLLLLVSFMFMIWLYTSNINISDEQWPQERKENSFHKIQPF